MLWLQRMRKKMNLKFDFTINYKNKLKSKRGERVRIRLWLRWLRSARTLILIVQMSECYLSVVSLLCVCIEWRIFSCMPFPTTQKQTRWKRKTRKNCPKEREREIFFNYLVFLLSKAVFRHESFSRTYTLINIYSLLPGFFHSGLNIRCTKHRIATHIHTPLIQLVRSQLQPHNIIHKFACKSKPKGVKVVEIVEIWYERGNENENGRERD